MSQRWKTTSGEAAWQAELNRHLEEVEKHPERLMDFQVAMKQLRIELLAMQAGNP